MHRTARTSGAMIDASARNRLELSLKSGIGLGIGLADVTP